MDGVGTAVGSCIDSRAGQAGGADAGGGGWWLARNASLPGRS